MKQLRRRRLQRLQRLRRLWRCKQLVKISSTKKRKDGHFIRVDPRKVVTKLREEDCVSCVSHGRSFSRSDFEESDKLEKKVWCNDTAVIWRYAHLMKISLRFLVYVEKASLSEIRKSFFSRKRLSEERDLSSQIVSSLTGTWMKQKEPLLEVPFDWQTSTKV